MALLLGLVLLPAAYASDFSFLPDSAEGIFYNDGSVTALHVAADLGISLLFLSIPIALYLYLTKNIRRK